MELIVTNKKQYKILWLDDDINEMDFFVKALKDDFFETVDTASTVEDAINFLSLNKYDLILADINMPYPNGIEFIRKVVSVSPSSIIIALSSYLYRQKYLKQLQAIEHPIELMDKRIPSPSTTEFNKSFVDPLLNLLASNTRQTVSEQIEKANRISDDPFSLKLDDWYLKNAIEKDIYNERAKKMIQDQLKDAFGSGIIWIMYCGNSTSPRALAKNESEIPSEKEIMEVAKMNNAVPFRFNAPIGVEDFWSNCDQGPSSNQDYPTVSIDIPEGTTMHIHFDTGSPVSFFSYEYLLSRNIISAPLNFESISANNFPYEFMRINEEFLMRSQPKGSGTRYIDFKGHAVKDWEEFFLARKCGWECQHSNENSNGTCYFRKGLVGRNILLDNDLSLILDGKNKTTKLA